MNARGLSIGMTMFAHCWLPWTEGRVAAKVSGTQVAADRRKEPWTTSLRMPIQSN